MNPVDERIGTADDLRPILLDGESPVFIEPTAGPMRRVADRARWGSAGELQKRSDYRKLGQMRFGPNEPEFFAVGDMCSVARYDLFVNLNVNGGTIGDLLFSVVLGIQGWSSILSNLSPSSRWEIPRDSVRAARRPLFSQFQHRQDECLNTALNIALNAHREACAGPKNTLWVT